jgi:hypothetical protein
MYLRRNWQEFGRKFTITIGKQTNYSQNFDYVATWGEKRHHCKFTLRNWSLWRK